jgi:integrase
LLDPGQRVPCAPRADPVPQLDRGDPGQVVLASGGDVRRGVQLVALRHVVHSEVRLGDDDVPTPSQVHLLASDVPERYRAGVYIAAGCGLRYAEIVGLELDHVDFLRREINVVQQLRQQAGGPAYIGLPKTKTSTRTGELPSVVADALAWHIQRFPPKVLEMEDRTDLRKPVTRPVKLLFTTATGLPVQRSSWSDGWKPAADAVEGIPEGFGVHGLRHYFAMLLIHGGASVKTVQMALGHSSPVITLGTYTHEWPEALDRTRSLVDAALGPAPVAREGVVV